MYTRELLGGTEEKGAVLPNEGSMIFHRKETEKIELGARPATLLATDAETVLDRSGVEVTPPPPRPLIKRISLGNRDRPADFSFFTSSPDCGGEEVVTRGGSESSGSVTVSGWGESETPPPSPSPSLHCCV